MAGGEAAEDEGDWTLDLECALVELTGWSLVDIDETDIESLIPFMFRYPTWKLAHKSGNQNQWRQLYADEADWL